MREGAASSKRQAACAYVCSPVSFANSDMNVTMSAKEVSAGGVRGLDGADYDDAITRVSRRLLATLQIMTLQAS